MHLLTPNDDYIKQINDIKSKLSEMDKPLIFRADSTDNVLKQLEKGFNKTCSYLEENGFLNPNELSMYDFRIKMEYVEEKIKIMKAKSQSK